MAVARAGDGLPNPALWGGGVRVDRKFGDRNISAGDLDVAARSAVSGARVNVNVPLAAIAYEGKIAGFVISDRNRAEDLVVLKADPWRYRNRPVRGASPRGAWAPLLRFCE